MSDVNRVRDDIAKSKDAEKRLQALQRLEASGDYRLIFTDGLFKDELTRAVLERFSASDERKDVLTKVVDAISYLHVYLRTIKVLGETAHLDIREGLLLLDELDEE